MGSAKIKKHVRPSEDQNAMSKIKCSHVQPKTRIMSPFQSVATLKTWFRKKTVECCTYLFMMSSPSSDWIRWKFYAKNKTNENRQFSPIANFGINQGQWPRMTFGRSKCNVRDYIWSASDLNHALCIPIPTIGNKSLETRFRWKSVASWPRLTS